MKKLLLVMLLFMLAAPAIAVDAKKPITSPEPKDKFATARTYFETLKLEDEHRQLYLKTNTELLETLMAQRPCISKTVLNRIGDIGEFPAKEFEQYYVERIVTELTEDDLKRLIDFYRTYVGKIFIDWRMKNSGKSTSTVPLSDESDVAVYAEYEDVLLKEHAALLKLSAQGPLLPEAVRKRDDAKITADVEALVKSYVDEKGECPQ